MPELVFLKLGGSLITDKTQPYTARLDVLADLALQIANVRQERPDLLILLGHGSGSFGHTAAKEYKTREGISVHFDRSERVSFPHGGGEPEKSGYWRGFAEVWYQASKLNRFVVQALHEAGIPVMTFSPAACVWAENGRVEAWETSQMEAALAQGILPVIHGDVIFDHAKGGTILSTEDLFLYLARELRPQRILLAGLEAAVWADYPARQKKVERITRKIYAGINEGLGSAAGADVTGGMASKVRQMLDLVEQSPNLSAQIFSGEPAGNLRRALQGQHLGTLIENA